MAEPATSSSPMRRSTTISALRSGAPRRCLTVLFAPIADALRRFEIGVQRGTFHIREAPPRGSRERLAVSHVRIDERGTDQAARSLPIVVKRIGGYVEPVVPRA